jgi:HEAT repeats
MNQPIFIAMAVMATGLTAQQPPAIPAIPFPPLPSATPLAPVTPLTPGGPFDVQLDLGRMQSDLARAQQEMAQAFAKDWPRAYIAGTVGNTVFDALAGAGLAFQGRAGATRSDVEYDQGTRALDDHRYEDAVKRFDAVIDSKSARADGALYWKAYALNRLGRRDDALAAITVLRRDYASSRWLNDAQALAAEIGQSSGKTASPAQETNEDLKLMAINSLMNVDPERALPLIEGILKGNSSPKVKDRALFVLTQNSSPRAQQILNEYARGAGNPDLQIKAIRYVGMSGTKDAQQLLTGYYNNTNDPAVKRVIIQSLMAAQASGPLFNLAKNEKRDDLRELSISMLGAMRATDQLSQLYASETSTDNRIRIVRALFIAGATDKLLDLMKNEKDPKVREEAIRSYARTPGATAETLAGFYSANTDPGTRRAIVNGLFERGDGKLLVDLARKESDPAMKSYIVQRLGNMPQNKEATDYMIELLK